MSFLQLVSFIAFLALVNSQKEDECKEFKYKGCNDLGYNQAAFPNPYISAIKNPTTTTKKLKAAAKVVKSGCHKDAQKYLCATFAAPCDKENHFCKKDCVEFKKACANELKAAKVAMPCAKLPDCKAGSTSTRTTEASKSTPGKKENKTNKTTAPVREVKAKTTVQMTTKNGATSLGAWRVMSAVVPVSLALLVLHQN